MKKLLLIIFLVNFQNLLAHEDQFIGIEKSNIHITLKLDSYDTNRINQVTNYAEFLNNFIKSNFSSEKVYLRYDYDYIMKADHYIIGSYTDFKNILPCNFRIFFNEKVRPTNTLYDMNFINNNKGPALIINNYQLNIDEVLKAITYLVHTQPQKLCLFSENRKDKLICVKGMSSEINHINNYMNYHNSYNLINDVTLHENNHFKIVLSKGKHQINSKEIEPYVLIREIGKKQHLIFINRQQFYFLNGTNDFDNTLYSLKKPYNYFGNFHVQIKNDLLEINSTENKWIFISSLDDPLTATDHFKIQGSKLEFKD
ncbi:hypothetical protein [Paenimyroides baculatum]|uniref:Uncharacterized protein n=1 Tax=Paenimyroides baculatum TaxID=2608000 RepID=A0A5M6CD30_9FLAO|nr:hypothetical protein [Paenimyroides baculatum]KAA5533074.1 hypothetical protein F0460_12295 [Paenimyroides baculatum]